MRPFAYIIMVFLMCGCAHREPGHFTHEVLNRMTPVKNQGESQTCWIYAMQLGRLREPLTLLYRKEDGTGASGTGK